MEGGTAERWCKVPPMTLSLSGSCKEISEDSQGGATAS